MNIANQILGSENKENRELPIYTVEIKDPYFTRTVKMASIQSELSDFRDEFLIIPVMGNLEVYLVLEEGLQRLKQFRNALQNVLRSIKVHKIQKSTLAENEKMRKFWIIADTSFLIGFRLFWKEEGGNEEDGHSVGDILLYYREGQQEEVESLESLIIDHIHDEIFIDLSEMFNNFQIAPEVQKIILNEIVKKFGEEIEAEAMKVQIFVESLSLCWREVNPFAQDSLVEEVSMDKAFGWSLSLKIFGNHCTLFQLTKNLQILLKSLPIFLVDLTKIRNIKISEIKTHLPEETVMIQPQLLLLMTRKIDTSSMNDLIRRLYTGYETISNEVFSEEEFLFLKQEEEQGRLKNYLKEKKLSSHKFSINKYRLIVKCYSQIFPKLLEALKEFTHEVMNKFNLAAIEPVGWFSQYFFKFHEKALKEQFYCQFSTKNGSMWLKSYHRDVETIIIKLRSLKQRLKQQFKFLPSIKPISKIMSTEQKIGDLYIIDPKPLHLEEEYLYNTCYALKNQSKIQFNIDSYHNLAGYEKNCVFIMFDDLPPSAQVMKVCQMNQIDVKEFFHNVVSEYERLRLYKLSNSTQFESITLIYFNPVIIKNDHIESDVLSLLRSQASEPALSLKLVFPPNSNKLIEEILPKILRIIMSEPQAERGVIHLLYEERSIIPLLENNLLRVGAEVEKKTIPEWGLMKIYNLGYYVMSYFYMKKTFQMSFLDSFFVNYELTKNKDCKGKALFTLLTPESQPNYPQHYLMNLKENVVYHFLTRFSIKTYNIKQTGQELQRLFKTLREEAKTMEYFSCYGQAGKGGIIGEKVCLKMCYINEKKNKKKEMIPLTVDLQNRKITISDDEQNLPYFIQNKKFEWFKICAHDRIIPNIISCLQAD